MSQRGHFSKAWADAIRGRKPVSRYVRPVTAAGATGGRRRRRRVTRRVVPRARAPASRYGRRRVVRRTRGTRGLTAAELQAMQQVYGGNFFRRPWRGVKRVCINLSKIIN